MLKRCRPGRPALFAMVALACVLVGGPAWSAVCGDSTIESPESCDPPAAPACDCCTDHGTPGCTSPVCEGLVCDTDSFCCNANWDSNCANAASVILECLACCDAVCRDNCTFCGDFAVQGQRGETCDPPGFPAQGANSTTSRTPLQSETRVPEGTIAPHLVFNTEASAAARAAVECQLVDFEGATDGVPIGTVSGSPELTFDPSWLAVVDSDAGGSGDFANEPTRNTIASSIDGIPGPINFETGVRFVEVFYSATAGSVPVTLTAWDSPAGTGAIVGTVDGNTIGSKLDGATCAGDPGGDVCLWDSIQLISTTDDIWSLTLSGASDHMMIFDNMTFCTGLPAMGACCLGSSSCSITTAASCNSLGGFYQGDSTTCDACPEFCRNDCTYCGDGVPDPGEECDDGNNQDGDGCSAVCTMVDPFCGDGTVGPGEGCDPPGSPVCDCCFEHATAGCSDTGCELAVCTVDSFCCDVLWDSICVEGAQGQPACDECCGNLCHDDCTFCGDLVVNGAVTLTSELIANGDFEVGALTSWTTAELPGSGGMFQIAIPGSPTPMSGAATAPNPDGGSFYAIADELSPGTHTLLQTFTVPIGAASVELSFEMFVADCGLGPIVDPAGLDHTVGPNQHARVDILTDTALPFDTGPGVLANLYLGVDGAFGVPYTPYYFDLTGMLTAGTTYQLRFAETLNQCVLNQGIDNLILRAVVPGGPLVEECDPPQALGPPRCDCCVQRPSSGCSNATCEALVCGGDPFCCAVEWDASCAADASAIAECDACCSPEICSQECLICTDSDVDGLCDTEDPCVLSPNPGSGVAVFGQTLLALDKTSFGWAFPENVVSVRGDLGLVSVYDVLATDSFSAAISIPAPETSPTSGGGLYWLLRPDCDPASYSSGGSSECTYGCLPGERDGNLP